MAENPTDGDTPDDSVSRTLKSRKSAFIRQVILTLTLVMVLTTLLAYSLYRYSISSRVSQISRLGGEVYVGPHPLLIQISTSSKYPDWMRKAAESSVGKRAFYLFPAVYGIDYRGINDPDDVETALTLVAECNVENVRVVTLFQSGVQDDHLRMVVQAFPNLEQLKINGTAITDAGIAHLRDHRRLRHINAQQTAISDACLTDLASIRRLKELNIAETTITTVQPILDVCPRCRITQDLVTLTNSTDRQRRAMKSKSLASP
jgi:hypothetical protein